MKLRRFLERNRDITRTRWALALLTLTLIIAGLVSFFGLVPLGPPLPRLELSITPNAIPPAGFSWSVSSTLYYPGNKTGFSVDSTVTMSATHQDGTKTVQTKNTTAGTASFLVPPDTIGVRFRASNGNYTSKVYYIAGPTVISSNEVWTYLYFALAAAFASVTASVEMWWKIRAIGLKRGIPPVSGTVVAFLLPFAYIAANQPDWEGAGWLPNRYLGLPLYYIPVISGLLAAISAGWSRGVAKRQAETAKASEVDTEGPKKE